MKIKPISAPHKKHSEDKANEIREQLARAGVEKILEELQAIGDTDLVDAKEREVHVRIDITE